MLNQSYPKADDRTTPQLSDEHRRMLEEESAISPECIAARGYWTAAMRVDVPDVFSKWQRRRGLVVPSLSPDCTTVVYQLRPDTPIRRKDGSAPKYETPTGDPVTLDVNPLKLEEVRSGIGDLWVTEGAKKVDALASVGEAAVGGRGVYMFAEPGSKGTVPLRCWRYVRLRGRRVIIVLDADARTNAAVQEALRRLVMMLEGLGATVLVVYLPAVNGDSKAGVDDYLAAGGTVEELRSMARPYEPVDVAGERLSRDEGLRAAVGDLWRSWREMPARKIGECSERAVMRVLTGVAGERGKFQADGVFVIYSMRDIAVEAQLSLGGTKNALDRLEAAGRLRREMWGRAKDKPGAYVLLTPWGGGSAEREHNGKEAGSEESVPQEGESFSQLSKAPSDRGVHVARAPTDEVPELRWPKVVHTWGWRESKRVVVDSVYVRRLGKRRGEIIRYLLENGAAAVSELVEAFGAKSARPRDFRRRILGPLETEGIIAVADETAELTPAWREALEHARERDEEIKDARLQAAKFEREKKAFRRAAKDPAAPTPETRGREHVERTLEHHRPRWAREEAEELRRMVRPAADFAQDILGHQEYVRLGLLEEMWSERGGMRRHLRIALRELRCKVKRHAEHPGELFVYPPEEASEAAPVQEAPDVVVPMHPEMRKPEVEPSPRREESSTSAGPRKVNGVIIHGSECDCEWCADPPEPSYVKIGGLA